MSFTLQPPSEFYRQIQALKRAAEEAFVERGAGDADDFFMACMEMFADLRDAIKKYGVAEPDKFLQSVEAHHAATNSGISDMAAILHQDLPTQANFGELHIAFRTVQSALTRIAEGATPHVSLFLNDIEGCLRIPEWVKNGLASAVTRLAPLAASLA